MRYVQANNSSRIIFVVTGFRSEPSPSGDSGYWVKDKDPALGGRQVVNRKGWPSDHLAKLVVTH